MLQSFTPLPVSAQIALEPAANLSREKAGGDVNCKLARMTRPEPTPAEEPRAEHPPSKTGQEPDFWFVRAVTSCAPGQ